MSEGSAAGRPRLGIELGSTRIKACLIDADHRPIAVGRHVWENRLVDGVWTYSLDDVWGGLRCAVADLAARLGDDRDDVLGSVAAVGVSAMMHGYLAFDETGSLLTPFRTWRNTSTAAAAARLGKALGCNIPHRWSVAHLYQAVLDGEQHVPHVRFLTTLAGYVHWRLTGRKVLGMGDASGMFPVDATTGSYDSAMLEAADELLAADGFDRHLAGLLPSVLAAGEEAGVLTAEGAGLLDESGALPAGIPMCPPEGDASTGMVATHSIAPRTGNVSVGTSIFAMVVLEGPTARPHPEIDIVATPAGAPVAMVHCNNGASEFNAWASVFHELATSLGSDADQDAVFAVLLRAAAAGEADGGGVLSYNQLSGEPVLGDLEQGRPLIVRTPDSRLSLANLSRSLVFGIFGTLTIGMRVLAEEGIRIDRMLAHGGLFRTPGPAQALLAAALDTPVAVGDSAGESGAWGAAVLASFMDSSESDLEKFLDREVFAHEQLDVVRPDPDQVLGYRSFLERYVSGLAVERAAVGAVP